MGRVDEIKKLPCVIPCLREILPPRRNVCTIFEIFGVTDCHRFLFCGTLLRSPRNFVTRRSTSRHQSSTDRSPKFVSQTRHLSSRATSAFIRPFCCVAILAGRALNAGKRWNAEFVPERGSGLGVPNDETFRH